MSEEPPSHLLLAASLALVAAIPNNTARYSALVAVAIFTVVCTIQLKSPLAQLHRLAVMIDETDEFLRRTMAQCPRDYLHLTVQMGHLLEANKTASQIKCRALTSERAWWSDWHNYHVLSKSITACSKRVKAIRVAIQLTVEAEIQRRVEYDTAEVQFILMAGTASNTASQQLYDEQVHYSALFPLISYVIRLLLLNLLVATL
ncbi:hypothetical protein MSAN_01769600 [Mycena sanguinolenta]|uniref:Uncharacterized protein n=1 Tax=Mycena sanguinolenta TaxID=230812 RepID=A0A8H6XVZ6_9AGAR|nr:hypothetical protein MSAN_01769600 [Mycena sanguinolenta]